jgi:hypothetical protein
MEIYMQKTKSYIDGLRRVYHLYGRELAYELRGNSAAQRAALAAQYLRGEVQVILINHGTERFTVERGMRTALLVVVPVPAPDCEWLLLTEWLHQPNPEQEKRP